MALARNWQTGLCWDLPILASPSLLSSKSIPWSCLSLIHASESMPQARLRVPLDMCPQSLSSSLWSLPLLHHSPAHWAVAHPPSWMSRNYISCQPGSKWLPRHLLLPCPGVTRVARAKVCGALSMSQETPDIAFAPALALNGHLDVLNVAAAHVLKELA